MGLHSSEDITDLNNYEISESNIKCEECTIQLCIETKKSVIEITSSSSLVIEKKLTMNLEIAYLESAKNV